MKSPQPKSRQLKRAAGRTREPMAEEPEAEAEAAETSESGFDIFEEPAQPQSRWLKSPRPKSKRPKRRNPVSISLQSPRPRSRVAEEPEAEVETAETSESGFDFFEEPAATEPAIEAPQPHP